MYKLERDVEEEERLKKSESALAWDFCYFEKLLLTFLDFFGPGRELKLGWVVWHCNGGKLCN